MSKKLHMCKKGHMFSSHYEACPVCLDAKEWNMTKKFQDRKGTCEECGADKRSKHSRACQVARGEMLRADEISRMEEAEEAELLRYTHNLHAELDEYERKELWGNWGNT